jgi:hypothetical protein
MRQSNISEAKQYIIDRIEAETSYHNNLYDIIDKYALSLADLSYSAGIQPNSFSFSHSNIKVDVDKLIARLEDELIDYIDTLAVARHTDDKDDILAYIHATYNNDTLDDIIHSHTDHWKKEVEASITAALLTSVAKDRLIASLKEYRTNTWRNPILLSARKAAHTNSKVNWLYSNPKTDIGNSNNGVFMLDSYGQFMIAMGWTKYFYDDAINKGAIAFKVYRSSNYPCNICDFECSYIHYDMSTLPPYHRSCRCFIVPIFDINEI